MANFDGVEGSSSQDQEVLLASNTPKKKAGRKIFQETRHPIYRGVRRRNSGKWVCEMREPNKKSRIWLGTYPTVEMAARAHDVAAIALRGKSACLNFADSAWRLPIPASKETSDIQKAAGEAAEAFRPSMQVGEVGSGEDVNSKEEEEEEEEEENVFSLDGDVSGKEEDVFSPEEKVLFMDEDDVFDMHGLISNMAEGLMLPPPPLQGIDDEAQEDHTKLWNF